MYSVPALDCCLLGHLGHLDWKPNRFEGDVARIGNRILCVEEGTAPHIPKKKQRPKH